MDDYIDYSGNDGITAPEVNTDTYDAYDFGGSEQAGWQGADIMEGLDATGIDLSGWWGDAASSGAAAQPEAGTSLVAGAGGAPSIASSFEKFLSGAGDFVSKYKAPLEMVARGVGAAMKAKNDEKNAQRVSDNRIAEMQAADQLRQNAAGRYSDSVKGLRTGGLINAGPLKRKDGSQVYTNNGLINRG